MKKEKLNNYTNRKIDKKWRLILVLISLVASQSFAQYEIKKYTINSGGVQSMSAGPYQVSASIGQVDASNALRGGSYKLKGGFWNKTTSTNEIIFANSFEQL